MRDGEGRTVGWLESFEPVAENPVFTLELRPGGGSRNLRLDGRDNQGGEFGGTVPLPWVQSALEGETAR